MDASALALSLDRSRGSEGAISLRELQKELLRSGLEEFARAVDALAARLGSAKLQMDMDSPIVPWL
jgi:hypothetical protein